MSEANPHARAEHALRQASRASKAGDVAAAERWSKTAERLAAAAERLAGAPAFYDPEENAEAKRAELRARVTRMAKALREISDWENERDAYEAAVVAACANALEPPPPLRPHPAGAMANDPHVMELLRAKEEGA
jgi:hypothetical protein